MNETADILCFGAHADDVEIGMGGTIAKYVCKGKTVVIVDLTQANLSSNGTVDIRLEEANQAAQILGVMKRENLQMPDRDLLLSSDKIAKVTWVIRKYRPKAIFSPYGVDRHPDHGACTEIVKEAIFSSGIFHYLPDCPYPPVKVLKHYLYMINGFHTPDFYVDISDNMETKLEALRAYASQFSLQPDSVKTPLTEGYLSRVKNREFVYGQEIQCAYAEGFFHQSPFQVDTDWLG